MINLSIPPRTLNPWFLAIASDRRSPQATYQRRGIFGVGGLTSVSPVAAVQAQPLKDQRQRGQAVAFVNTLIEEGKLEERKHRGN